VSPRHAPGWVLPASLLLALVAGLLPLPAPIGELRPWLLGPVMAYWLLEAPQRVGLGVCFAVGLLGDLAFGTLLGEQAMRLVILGFIVQRFRARLRFFPLWQQALAIGALLLNDRVVHAAVVLVAGQGWPPLASWASPVLGMLLWPWLFLLLDAMRLRRRERG
jgi:rod shape-determining protein MreD